MDNKSSKRKTKAEIEAEKLKNQFESMVINNAKTNNEYAEQRANEKSEDNMNDSLNVHESNSNKIVISIEPVQPAPIVAKIEREKFNNYIRKDLINRLDTYRAGLNKSRSNVLEEIIEKYLDAIGK